jgi:uncharacterized protein involved in exopolysaccharide biosynthesis
MAGSPPLRDRSAASSLLSEGISPGQLVRAVRQNLPLSGFVAALVLVLTGFLIFGSSAEYSARAVIRMASERRTLTSGVEDAPQAVDRPVDPVLSAVQVLTSRTLVGSVVDTLGVRLQPVSARIWTAPLFGRQLPVGALRSISVIPLLRRIRCCSGSLRRG